MSTFDPGTQRLDGFWSVSASAGTGKTFSISILWLRLILERGLPVEHILVQTFTEAATFELQERLLSIARDARAQIVGEARENPAAAQALAAARRAGIADTEAQRRLEAAISDFDLAPISTIHGFCKRLLDTQVLELGSDPEAELVENHQDLIDRLIDDWLMRHADDEDVDPSHLRAIAQAVLAEAGVRREDVLPQALAGIKERIQVLEQQIEEQWQNLRAMLGDGDDLNQVFIGHGISNGTHRRGIVSRVADFLRDKKPAKQLTDTGRRALEASWPEFLGSYERCQKDMGELASLYAQRPIAGLLDDLFRVLPVRRRASGRTSFDDLLVQVRDALRAPSGAALAAAVRGGLAAVIIDECQDCDAIQIETFERLFVGADGGPVGPLLSCFLIGDPKQSIYRFRGADLGSYTRLTARAAPAPDMVTNYRSDPGLVATINAWYTARHHVFVGPAESTIPYVGVKAHHQKSRLQDPQCPQPVSVLWSSEDSRRFAKADLAVQVADECRRLLAGEVQLPGPEGLRRVQASDIAVLADSHADLSRVRRALQARGIPVQQAGRGLPRVLESDEALDWQDWLAALAAVDLGGGLRRQAMTFACSPLAEGGLPEESRLLALCDELAFEATLLRRHGPLSMFHRRLAAGRDAEALRGVDGERRLTNWRHVAVLLQQAWTQGHRRPAALLDRLSRPPAELGEALQQLETDRPAVQLVTIHTSKGLEYPIVFCPYLWNLHSRQRRKSALTVAVTRAGQGPSIDTGSENLDQAKDRVLDEERDELERRTYVALTRAVHRCYVGLAPVADAQRGHHMNGSQRTPIARLLFGSDGEQQPMEQWDSVLTACGLMFDCAAPGDDTQAPRVAAAAEQAPLIEPPVLDLSARPVERRTSFSGLHAGSHHVAVDRDAATGAVTPRHGQPGLLHGLGGGAALGTRIHDLLEAVLGEGQDLDLLLEREPEKDRARLREVITTIGAQPLDCSAFASAPPTLRDFAADCICELPFLLRMQRLAPQALSQALLADPAIATDPSRRAWAEGIAAWSFRKMGGFLTGFIDLVVCYQGRWYLADYKTNQLPGYSAADCESAMLGADYLLQSLLYQVALHRHLRCCLGTDYDPAQHLGGALYLFVRGFPDAGIWHQQPSLAGVDALDQLFASEGA